MANNFLTPPEIVDYTEKTGKAKAEMTVARTIMLAFLAGVFIALASVGSNMIAHNIPDIGLSKYLAGLIFPTGLILVVIAGAELYTGNNMISIAALAGKVSWGRYLRNLALVWIGNLVGSVFIAWLIFNSGQFSYSQNLLGAFTVKVAAIKTDLTFAQAFSSGILCNLLVCLAVWMSYAAKDIAGKCLVIFFPIWLFIASGYEHSVANMYYISSGLFASSNPEIQALAISHYHVTPQMMDKMNLYGMFIDNLLPVSLGNLVGGGVLVAAWYWIAYKRIPDHKSV